MTRAVSRYDVDVFFFPAVYSYFPILNRSKVIVAIHDLIADHHPELVFQTAKSKYFWKIKQRAAVWQADVIATVSNYSKREIVEYFRVPESRVRVISEGTRPVFSERPRNNGFLAACSKFGITEDEKVLLYVGGISPHKNIGRLLDACVLLRTKYTGNESFKLLLVGDYKDDPFLSAYPALKEQVGSLGLGDLVRFTGFVEDEELSYLYNAATAVILPSIEEGFGLPALEAMACGAPVAASDRGSLPEVLGDAGIYFDPMDPNSIAHALAQIFGDDSLRASMSELGLKRAGDFSWNRAARQTIAVFEELAGGGRQR
jgi:glycosyltransferase involved in cell wall biosynthesis